MNYVKALRQSVLLVVLALAARPTAYMRVKLKHTPLQASTSLNTRPISGYPHESLGRRVWLKTIPS